MQEEVDKNSDNEDEEFFDCPDDPDAIKFASLDKIYAICLPATPSVATPAAAVASDAWRERLLLFPSSGEALAKLKEHRNARYKVFNSYPEAKQFASTADEQLTPKRPSKKSPNRTATVIQDTDCFKSVSQVQLNQLKAAINTGDLATVSALIWNNPKHLVTDCDAPTLLMPRFRYNCLHQAALRNQSAVIKLLLAVLSGDEFWRRLNAETGAELRRSRRDRLLDLYLNGREMALRETPLHIAAKFCYADCVRYLVARRECDIGVLNNAGQTALEIVGSRCDKSASSSRAVTDTRLALCGQFVPLLADASTGAVRVGQPVPAWGLRDLLDDQQPRRLLVRAYAGPAEPELARSLYERWRAPSRVLLFCRLNRTAVAAAAPAPTDNSDADVDEFSDDRLGSGDDASRPPRLPPATPVPGRPAGFEFQSPTNMLRTSFVDEDNSRGEYDDEAVENDAAAAAVAEVASAPLLDYDKGFEITGRALCRALGGIPWHERWDFFNGDFADLATDDGLNRLNQLLAEAYERMENELGTCSPDDSLDAANGGAVGGATVDPWTDYRDGRLDDTQDDNDDSKLDLLERTGDSDGLHDNANACVDDLSDSLLERLSRWGVADADRLSQPSRAADSQQPKSTVDNGSASNRNNGQFRSPPPPPRLPPPPPTSTTRKKQQQQADLPPSRMSTPRQRRPVATDRRQLNLSPFEFVGAGKSKLNGASFSSPSRASNSRCQMSVTPLDLQVLRAISPASANAATIDPERYPSVARWRRSIGASGAATASASSEDVSKLLLQLPASPSLQSPSLAAAASPAASPLAQSPSLRRLAAVAAAAATTTTPRRRLAMVADRAAALNKSFDHEVDI